MGRTIFADDSGGSSERDGTDTGKVTVFKQRATDADRDTAELRASTVADEQSADSGAEDPGDTSATADATSADGSGGTAESSGDEAAECEELAMPVYDDGTRRHFEVDD